MKKPERTAKREAFSLLEIIIALSMLVLILGSVYGTYTATTRSLEHSKPRHALQQQASIFMQRISSEIRCCYAGYKHESWQPATKTIETLEKKHFQQEDAPLFIGGEVTAGRSFLQIVTSAVASKREHSLGGLAIVEYMLDSSTNTLSRSKRRYIGGFEVDRDNYNWIVVLENIRGITVEYFDGKEWLKEWNSNDMEGLLPKAVRISLVMQSEDFGPLSFISTFQIVCREKQSGGVTVQKTTESDKILQSINNNQSSNDRQIKKK
jgi:type II secretory pathway component PulJ